MTVTAVGNMDVGLFTGALLNRLLPFGDLLCQCIIRLIEGEAVSFQHLQQQPAPLGGLMLVEHQGIKIAQRLLHCLIMSQRKATTQLAPA